MPESGWLLLAGDGGGDRNSGALHANDVFSQVVLNADHRDHREALRLPSLLFVEVNQLASAFDFLRAAGDSLCGFSVCHISGYTRLPVSCLQLFCQTLPKIAVDQTRAPWLSQEVL